MNREEQFEALADTLGEASFAYNEFDSSDEATTCIKRGTSVDEVAEYLLAAGYRKLSLDDATVERAARVIDSQAWQDSWIEFNPEGCKRAREAARTKARAVLAAAVEAGR